KPHSDGSGRPVRGKPCARADGYLWQRELAEPRGISGASDPDCSPRSRVLQTPSAHHDRTRGTACRFAFHRLSQCSARPGGARASLARRSRAWAPRTPFVPRRARLVRRDAARRDAVKRWTPTHALVRERLMSVPLRGAWAAGQLGETALALYLPVLRSPAEPL